MARLHINTALAALSIFVIGVYLGVNLSNPIRCSNAVHSSADAALVNTDIKTLSNADILPPAVAAKNPPPNSVEVKGPPSNSVEVKGPPPNSVEVKDLVSNTDRVYTFSGRPAPIPVEGHFQTRPADCSSSSVKLFPSTKVSKECAWIVDLDALKSLGYSANHQDAIVETIFNQIGRTNKFYVEFGFGYGHFDTEEDMRKAGLNTGYMKLKGGWNGVYFDPEMQIPKWNVIKALLTEANIVQTFQAAKVPYDVDFVSIDVDSVDFWLLKGLLAHDSPYRPRVIQCEYNQLYGPDQFITNRPIPKKFEGKGDYSYAATSYGASAAALNLLASAAGYTCVYLLHDIIFVRTDLLSATGCKNPPPFGAIVNGKIPRHVGFKPCGEQHLGNLLEVHSILAYPHLEDYSNYRARAEIDRLYHDYNMDMCSSDKAFKITLSQLPRCAAEMCWPMYAQDAVCLNDRRHLD